MSNTSETPIRQEIDKLQERREALQTAIHLLLGHDFTETPAVLIEIRDEIDQQINDLEIDANALPFPEK